MVLFQDLCPLGENKGVEQEWGFPSACVALQSAAESVCPTAIVWRGDSELLTHQQGVKVLGTPLGHPDFVQRFLEGKIAEHRVLLERIPEVPDTVGVVIVVLLRSRSGKLLLEGS